MCSSDLIFRVNGMPYGQVGVRYSCVEGSEPTCLNGFEGDSYSDSPYPGTRTESHAEMVRCK